MKIPRALQYRLSGKGNFCFLADETYFALSILKECYVKSCFWRQSTLGAFRNSQSRKYNSSLVLEAFQCQLQPKGFSKNHNKFYGAFEKRRLKFPTGKLHMRAFFCLLCQRNALIR